MSIETEVNELINWHSGNAGRLQNVMVRIGREELYRRAVDKGREKEFLEKKIRDKLTGTVIIYQAWLVGRKIFLEKYGNPVHESRSVSAEQILKLERFSEARTEYFRKNPSILIKQHRYSFVRR